MGGCFFFKQKTAYEMCGRDWSSDVCSSDLRGGELAGDLERLWKIPGCKQREHVILIVGH